MTRFIPLLALALVACGQPKADKAVIERVEQAQRHDTDADGRIACARAGQAELARDCTVERIVGANGLELTLHHPDGGFRRLLVTTDGRGVIAADGAQPARVSVVAPDEIEVAIAGERYRLPATIKGAARQ